MSKTIIAQISTRKAPLMSEYNFKYSLLKRRSPFLDFLKVDGELIERLRSW